MKGTRTLTLVVVCVAAILVAESIGVAAPPAGVREREMEAKGLFIAGEYREALLRFSTLYAETSDPIYLRNMARCHQKLRQPDEAIYAFRRYLLENTSVGNKERKEIEGYVAEMESLKREQAAAHPAAGVAAPVAPPPPTTTVDGRAPPATATSDNAPPKVALPAAPPPAPMLVTSPPPPEPQRRGSSTWIWIAAGAAVVVAGGVAAALLLSNRDPSAATYSVNGN